MTITIKPKDRHLLRELAKRVAEIGHLPIQQEKAALWTRHDDLECVRPMVLVYPGDSWRELLPDSELCTEGEFCRGLERDLRRRIYHHERLADDNVIEPVVFSHAVVHETGWGLEEHWINPEDATGAHRFEPVIREESDLDKLRTPQVTVDWEATKAQTAILRSLFDGILTVEPHQQWTWDRPYMVNMDEFATLRGLDQLLLDLVDRPEWVHQAMEKMLQGRIAQLEAMLATGLVTVNNRNQFTGSGGMGYTAQLPQADFDGVHVRAKDLWGFAATQIFSEVSPAMHEEFALQYERRYLSRFGLNSYGCCEPLHNKLDLIKTIPNLRRVSISSWADAAKSAEGLGNRYIFSYKPNPAIVAGEGWNPEAVRKGLREVLEQTKGCVVEIILKDVQTCRQQPQRLWNWVRIARETIEEFA